MEALGLEPLIRSAVAPHGLGMLLKNVEEASSYTIPAVHQHPVVGGREDVVDPVLVVRLDRGEQSPGCTEGIDDFSGVD